MATEKNKKICFTLDLENDYGRLDEYSALSLAPKLLDLFKKYNLKMTIFATGKIIKEKPEIIKLFQDNLNCEFQLHSYSHEVNKILTEKERLADMRLALESYKNYFGKNPDGYRAPCGDLKDYETEELKKGGFLYSSSFITAFRPGKFNNLGKSDKIFRQPSGLTEIPFSSLPFIKLPYSLGYFKILGWQLVKFLVKRKEYGRPIVFAFHLHDLKKLDNIKKLPKPLYKLFYLLRNKNKGFEILEKFIKLMDTNGYKSEKLTDIAKKIS